MRSVIALALVGLLALGTLGCGSAAKDASKGAGPKATAPAKTPGTTPPPPAKPQ